MPHLPAQDTADMINKSAIVDRNQGPAQNAMLADENLIVNIWEQLNLALDMRVESLSMLLGELCFQIRRSPLPMGKCF